MNYKFTPSDKIGVVGLGYVGLTTAVCLAAKGYHVIGCEVDLYKIDLIKRGQVPFIEDKVPDLLNQALRENKFYITNKITELIEDASIIMICVGTPMQENGLQNLEYIRNVVKDLGLAIADKKGFFVVVTRSTMLPYAHLEIMDSLLSRCKERDDCKVYYCINPEFLREGKAVDDFFSSELNVIGSDNTEAAEIIQKIYQRINIKIEVCSLKMASLLKYACNAYHALKICFANEMGRLSKEIGCDGQELMKLFCMDNKLNTGSSYLNPGFAYGGSCLPKDIAALLGFARENHIELPVLNNIILSNRTIINTTIDFIRKLDPINVLFCGITFKKGTDDLRGSPYIDLAEAVIGQGRNCFIYDDEIHIEQLHGSNIQFALNRLPHIKKHIISDLNSFCFGEKSLVVISKPPRNNQMIILESFIKNTSILDLIGSRETRILKQKSLHYYGIAW